MYFSHCDDKRADEVESSFLALGLCDLVSRNGIVPSDVCDGREEEMGAIWKLIDL